MTHATDDEPRPRLGASRERVLAGLRAAAGDLGAVELAERLALHPNSVRYHLDALHRAGLVDRRSHMTGRRGRPELRYRAVAGPSADGPLYRALTEAVAGSLAATADPHDAAVDAGRVWGRLLAGPVRAGAVAALDTLAEILRIAGFRPQLVDAPERIDLHACRVREVVREQGAVVCALHLGVVQGALAHLDAPVRAESARPFVTSTTCHVHLRPRLAAGSEEIGEPRD
jgi:predicted ArsR family transcriptional regulator